MSHLLSSISTAAPTPAPPVAPSAAYPDTYVSNCSPLLPHGKAASLSPENAASLFEVFCQELAPLFPFVMLPPTTTERQLFQERPMLHMAIMAVACQSDLELQVTLARTFREEISRAIFVSGEKNLVMLQAILVFLAWSVAPRETTVRFIFTDIVRTTFDPNPDNEPWMYIGARLTFSPIFNFPICSISRLLWWSTLVLTQSPPYS